MKLTPLVRLETAISAQVFPAVGRAVQVVAETRRHNGDGDHRDAGRRPGEPRHVACDGGLPGQVLVLPPFTESSTLGRVIRALRGPVQERHLSAAGRRDAPSPRPAGQLNGCLRQRAPSTVAHRSVLALAVLVPNQAAFPDTARLLPVMVPTMARASRPEVGRHDLVFIGPSRLGYA